MQKEARCPNATYDRAARRYAWFASAAVAALLAVVPNRAFVRSFIHFNAVNGLVRPYTD